MRRTYSIALFVLLALCALVFLVYDLIMWALTFGVIAVVALGAYTSISHTESSKETPAADR